MYCLKTDILILDYCIIFILVFGNAFLICFPVVLQGLTENGAGGDDGESVVYMWFSNEITIVKPFQNLFIYCIPY